MSVGPYNIGISFWTEPTRLRMMRNTLSVSTSRAPPSSSYVCPRLFSPSGKNKTSEDAVGDAKVGVRKLARYADYLVINLSSPNTPGLRSLQQKSHLTAIIDGVHEELNELDKHVHRQGDERREGNSSSSSSNPSASSPFYPNQTGKRPLLFVKIAVRKLKVVCASSHY